MFATRFVRFFRYLRWTTIKKTIARVGERRLLGLSAEIAYNAMLSLFPAILAILTAIGLFEESLQSFFTELAGQISKVAPDEALVLIRDFAKQITQSQEYKMYFARQLITDKFALYRQKLAEYCVFLPNF
jgi:membrane protein